MKLYHWLLLYVPAAVAGIAFAFFKDRHHRYVRPASVHQESSLPARTTPEPGHAPDADPEPTPVPEPTPGLVRAQSGRLTLYSKTSGVIRRLRTVPDPFDAPPPELLSIATTPKSRVSPPVALPWSLMFPDPDASGLAGGAYTERELSMAVFAETRGLYPANVGGGAVYDPRRWARGFGPGSLGELTLARRMVAETRKRNKRTHLAYVPYRADRTALLAWYCCADAACDTVGTDVYPLPPGMTLHFFIRQKDSGRQKAPYLSGRDPVLSFGPFINVGGGDVPRGEATYIDFYVLPALRVR